jgi:plasmid stability protein
MTEWRRNTMSTLALNNIPDDLYRRLEALAGERRRSVNEEAVEALEKGLEQEERGPLDAGGFWEGVTIEQLAEAQQVRPALSPQELAGDWPEDESLDDFLAYVREARA